MSVQRSCRADVRVAVGRVIPTADCLAPAALTDREPDHGADAQGSPAEREWL